MNSDSPARFTRRIICSSSLILLMLAGCLAPPGSKATRLGLAPTMDRLVATYPDLATKKFRVLADFETPEQGTLFRMEPRGSTGSVGISTDRARSETGVGALRISLVRSSQRAVAADTPESKWALLRDWSGYHMLIFSIFSPRPLSGFSVSVTSGVQAPLGFVNAHVFLNQGWNLIRLDLGDMSDRINLGDVRELRFWCDPLDTPIDLFLDDLILVDNSRDLFGPQQRSPGDLYVRGQGQRLVVGSAERFELVFSRGRIRQWFDLGQDPQRIHNLTGPGSLGPSPVVPTTAGQPDFTLDDLSQWSPLGTSVEARQTVIETTPIRILVRGDCRFGPSNAAITESSPFHSWLYSIYADGRICVECAGSARAADFSPPRVGIAFACDGAAGFTPQFAETQQGTAPAYALFSRPSRGQADLLVVPSLPLAARPLAGTRDTRPGICFEVPVAQDVFKFAAMLRVWPADIDTPAHADPLAADYRRAPRLQLDAGRLVPNDPGDADTDGFSEARGYYVLQLDGNIAKVRIDGRTIPRFSPIFKIIDVADRDVWAYLDGRQIKSLYRDPEGNVLLQVPGTVKGEALLEITSHKRESTAKPR